MIPSELAYDLAEGSPFSPEEVETFLLVMPSYVDEEKARAVFAIAVDADRAFGKIDLPAVSAVIAAQLGADVSLARRLRGR